MTKTKSKRGKLPKKIAGVKLPKDARRQAERAIAELQKPIVREMIAGAVGMAAAALARQAAEWRAGQSEHKPDPDPKPPSASEERPAAKPGGGQFAEIATGLAVAGLGKLMEKMQAAGDMAGKPKPPKA